MEGMQLGTGEYFQLLGLAEVAHADGALGGKGNVLQAVATAHAHTSTLCDDGGAPPFVASTAAHATPVVAVNAVAAVWLAILLRIHVGRAVRREDGCGSRRQGIEQPNQVGLLQARRVVQHVRADQTLELCH